MAFSTRTRFPRALALVLTFLALPRAAHAGDETDVEARYRKAVAESQAGRSVDAARRFDEVLGGLTEEHPLRALALYGSARSHEKVDGAESACRALVRYRAYLKHPDSEPEKRTRAEAALGELLTPCYEWVAGASAAIPVAASGVGAADGPPLVGAEPAAGEGDEKRFTRNRVIGSVVFAALVGVLLVAAASSAD